MMKKILRSEILLIILEFLLTLLLLVLTFTVLVWALGQEHPAYTQAQINKMSFSDLFSSMIVPRLWTVTKACLAFFLLGLPLIMLSDVLVKRRAGALR